MTVETRKSTIQTLDSLNEEFFGDASELCDDLESYESGVGVLALGKTHDTLTRRLYYSADWPLIEDVSCLLECKVDIYNEMVEILARMPARPGINLEDAECVLAYIDAKEGMTQDESDYAVLYSTHCELTRLVDIQFSFMTYRHLSGIEYIPKL